MCRVGRQRALGRVVFMVNCCHPTILPGVDAQSGINDFPVILNTFD